ncbi:MAG: hypothetical protein JST26_07695 [Bacteroidetes bacterium]|nr:hypothetical protein [Bacteroidota bacterium]
MMPVVEIFKTNVTKRSQARTLVRELKKTFPAFRINFDLEDCDRILRVEGPEPVVSGITELMQKHQYQCEWIEN